MSFLGITCIIELVSCFRPVQLECLYFNQVLFAPVTESSLDVDVEWDVQLVQLFHVIFSTLRFVVVIRLGTAEDCKLLYCSNICVCLTEYCSEKKGLSDSPRDERNASCSRN